MVKQLKSLTFVNDNISNTYQVSEPLPAATTSANGLMSKEDKTKLDGIASGANKIVVDSSLSSTSTNPVQNKVVNAAINNAKSKMGFVTLYVSSWKDNGNEMFSQTITISNGTINSKVELQPDNAVLFQLINDNVISLRVDNNNGVFTAIAIGNAPTSNLTIQCTLTEVK